MTTKNLRPRDAASLILYRKKTLGFEVLMGRRHKNHVFMPDRLVFPGGAVDAADRAIVPATPLKPKVARRLQRAVTPARAQALAAAAVRETFEETGLMLAAPLAEPPKKRPEPWRPFFERELGPALHALDYFFRAVTPPGRVRRFDARFFLAPVAEVEGDIRGDGELIDIDWFDLARVKEHDAVHGITSLVLAEAETVLKNPNRLSRGARYSRHVRGEQVITRE